MTECIIKFTRGKREYYLQWDTQKGKPITKGMPLDLFKDWYRHAYGARGMREFPKLIHLARRTGSGWKGQTLEHIVSVNSAGEPGNLSNTQLIRKFCPETSIVVAQDRFPVRTPKGTYLFRANVGNFEEGVRVLEKENIPVITTQDIAYCRLACHYKANENLVARHIAERVNQGTWVAEFAAYYPNGDIVLTTEPSPLMASAHKATQEHMNGNEYFLRESFAKELRARAQQDPHKALHSGALLVTRTKKIATIALDSHPLGIFLFRDMASPYSRNFLAREACRDIPVTFCDKDYTEEQERPFARQLWLDTPVNGSGIDAGGHPMSDYYRRISGWKKQEMK